MVKSRLSSTEDPMLHVFFDVTRLCRRKIRMSGISRYGRNVLKDLLARATEPGNRIAVTCVISQVDRLQNADLVGFISEFGTAPLQPDQFLAAVDKARHASQYCVFFSPYEELPDFSKNVGVQRCITIHDLFHVERPDVYGYKFNNPHLTAVARSLDDDDFIITVSEFTRARVINRLGHAPENVRSVHLAAEDGFTKRTHEEIERVRKAHGIGQRYFVSLGQFDPRKNLGALNSSVADALGQIDDDVEFVLVAAMLNEDRTKELMEQQIGNNFDRVRIVSELDDDEFAALLSGAEFFLFPTLAEGFGLPIVEAFACGCPVIASSVTAMPEIAMDAALYVDPTRPEQITNAIVNLSNSASLRESLKENCERVSKRFRWTNTVDDVLAYLRVMARNSSETMNLSRLVSDLDVGDEVNFEEPVYPNRAIRGEIVAQDRLLIGQAKASRPHTLIDDKGNGVHAVEYLLPEAKADEAFHLIVPVRARDGFSVAIQIYSSSSRKQNDNQVTFIMDEKKQLSPAVQTTHGQLVASAEIGKGQGGWIALHANLNLKFAGETGLSVLVSPIPTGASELRYKGGGLKVLDCQPILFGQEK